MLDWLGLPTAASAHAGDIDRLMVLVHWLMLVLFVGWSVFFVYVLIRFRATTQCPFPTLSSRSSACTTSQSRPTTTFAANTARRSKCRKSCKPTSPFGRGRESSSG